MINEIQFSTPTEYFNSYRDNEGYLNTLSPISKINFFVGANNSGKSRFLRGLLRELYHYKSPLSDGFNVKFINQEVNVSLLKINKTIVINKVAKHIKYISTHIKAENDSLSVKNVFPKKSFLNEYDLEEVYSKIKNHLNILNNDWEIGTHISINLKKRLDEELDKILNYFNTLTPIQAGEKFKITYIPVVRTLRKIYEPLPNINIEEANELIFEDFKKISNDTQQIRTFLDHFISESNRKSISNKPVYDVQIDINTIFTGESLYEQVARLRNGKEQQRIILNGFEAFLSKSFFNNTKIEINAIKDERGEEVHIKIGNENEFPIYALGDGIQAIILLTFPLFYNQNLSNHIIFYEEPEMFLHPGMQRVFIDALLLFPNIQVFIATHSNHLLETSVDYPDEMSIFSLEKTLVGGEASFKIENLSSPNMSVLNLLGVRNSSVFLSNCTIWVEGISDRIYLRKFLELYMDNLSPTLPKFKEDIHYSFLEFGGNNIIHYDFSDFKKSEVNIFAKKITSRIFLIHDADKNKASRHESLFDQLGENYYKLPVLEIENLLTLSVLQNVLIHFKMPESDALEFNDLSMSDYIEKPLSVIVKNLIRSGHIKKIFSKAKETTTERLYDKASFARVAINHLHSWDDISQEGKGLVERIYEFIKLNNTMKSKPF